MFEPNNCIHPDCNRIALSHIGADGDIACKPGYCLRHSPDPEAAKDSIYGYIRARQKIVGLNACGLTFTDIDLTDKRFYGCNFQHCTFSNLQSEFFRSRMTFFDFSLFSDCNLLRSNLQFSSFAGATFSHILFTGSELVHNNFSGITAYQSSFDDSDLYNSRFISARLVDTSFRNCNIKKTIFHSIEQRNVSFKLSNTREAEFSAMEEIE